MKEINLREEYPFYEQDTLMEVPEEVELLFREYRLMEEAYRIRKLRYKAYYSLDLEGIEREVFQKPLTLEELVEEKMRNELLYKGLATLHPKQRQRIYAHYYLGMSKADIARAEGTDASSVRKSIQRGLRQLEKYFEKI